MVTGENDKVRKVHGITCQLSTSIIGQQPVHSRKLRAVRLPVDHRLYAGDCGSSSSARRRRRQRHGNTCAQDPPGTAHTLTITHVRHNTYAIRMPVAQPPSAVDRLALHLISAQQLVVMERISGTGATPSPNLQPQPANERGYLLPSLLWHPAAGVQLKSTLEVDTESHMPWRRVWRRRI